MARSIRSCTRVTRSISESNTADQSALKMATASPELQPKPEEFMKFLTPENSDRDEADSPSGQVTTAAGSDSDSSKEDTPQDDQPKAKPWPLTISIDASGSKSPSLTAYHHLSPNFVDYITDIGSLHPYLNRHNLLTRKQDADLSLTTISDIDKVNRLISWLPQKGPNFLDRFIKCLRDSATSANGTISHGELADLLESTRNQAEEKIREFGERNKTEVPKLETADGTGRLNVYKVDPEPLADSAPPMEFTPTGKGSSWQKYCSTKCLVFISLLAAVTIPLVIVIFVLLAQLPQFNRNEMPRPPSAKVGMTVELSFGLSTELLAKGFLGIDDGCCGCLYIIGGVQCHDLYDEYTSRGVTDARHVTFDLQYYWLLLGSHIEYTLAPDTHTEVWLFTDDSDSFFTGCFDILRLECSEYPLICHQFHNPLEKPATRTIHINESGNYFQCFDTVPPLQIQNVTVYDRSYNITKIKENPINVAAGKLTPFSFNNKFLHFSPSCVLFHLDECYAGGMTGQFSGSVSRRIDIVFFGGIVLFVVIIVFAVLVSICVYNQYMKHRN